MIDTATDTAAAKKALVRTYNTPSYADPWDCIQDYERVQASAAEHPNKGSAALSSVVGLPRERIRGWVDSDTVPDCYRGLQTAQDHDWFISDWSDTTAKALNCLSAWVLSSGSINDNWVPLFVTDDDREEIEALRGYAREAGLQLESTRRDDERPLEWRPTTDASVLGRVLHTWTDVKGHKNELASRFPSYPQYAPHYITRDFCRVYIQQRGSDAHPSPNFVQIKAVRSDRFRESLKDCLRHVVSDPELVTGEEWPIRVHEPAVSELAGYPDID